MESLTAAIYLCRAVFRRYFEKGRLTFEEKHLVLDCIQWLFRNVSYLPRQGLNLFRKFEVPGIQYCCLEYEGANTDEQRGSGYPFQ